MQDAKRVLFNPLVAERKNTSTTVKRGLEISARTSGASKSIEVEVDKPLGLTLGQKSGGGVVITVSNIFCPAYDLRNPKCLPKALIIYSY